MLLVKKVQEAGRNSESDMVTAAYNQPFTVGAKTNRRRGNLIEHRQSKNYRPKAASRCPPKSH